MVRNAQRRLDCGQPAGYLNGDEPMSARKAVKLCVDLTMLALLPMLMAYSMIGEAAHEWLGLAMVACFIVHQLLNLKWYRALGKGRYTPVRAVSTVLNLLLVLVLLTQGISGILMSRYAIPISGVGGMSATRTFHLLGSHWGFVLISLHLGFHAGQSKRKPRNSLWIWLLRLLALMIAVWGVCVFAGRHMADYLFLKSQFVFYDFNVPRTVHIAETYAMLGLFCCIGYYGRMALYTMTMRTRRGEKL